VVVAEVVVAEVVAAEAVVVAILAPRLEPTP